MQTAPSRPLDPQKQLSETADNANYPKVPELGSVSFRIEHTAMRPADRYRKKAAELRALAAAEPDRLRKAEYLALSQSYLRLVEQADRNQHMDVSYETPVGRNDDHSSQ